jgi:hypothetical protein
MSLRPKEEIGEETHPDNDQFYITGLKMYTLYSPAHHKDGIIHSIKKEAETKGEEFDGVTTESFNKHVVRDESLFSH